MDLFRIPELESIAESELNDILDFIDFDSETKAILLPCTDRRIDWDIAESVNHATIPTRSLAYAEQDQRFSEVLQPLDSLGEFPGFTDNAHGGDSNLKPSRFIEITSGDHNPTGIGSLSATVAPATAMELMTTVIEVKPKRCLVFSGF
jgi:hypothetical protein